MATKREGDSCYDKAALDEPIFVLRANDRLAPMIVRFWARIADMMGVNRAKVQKAEVCAMKMEEWAVKRGSKLPD